MVGFENARMFSEIGEQRCQYSDDLKGMLYTIIYVYSGVLNWDYDIALN